MTREIRKVYYGKDVTLMNKMKDIIKGVGIVGAQCAFFCAAAMTLSWYGVCLICEDLKNKLNGKKES